MGNETTFQEIIRYLEKKAESIPYIDPDFDILVVEESLKPIMIMSPEVLKKLTEMVVGPLKND